MTKPFNPDEWAAINDGDTLSFDGGEPSLLVLRSFGGAAVYLLRSGSKDLLVASGDGELSLNLRLPEPHQLKVLLQLPELPAAYRAQSHRHNQPDMSGQGSLVVIKPRIQESEEMRMIRLMMRQQRESFERRLTEMQNAGTLDRGATHGSARVPDSDGEAPRAPAPEPDAGGSSADPTGDGANGG